MTSDRAVTAVLVVDLQVGVVRDCFDADGVLARTQALIDRARIAGTPVLYVQHEEDAAPRHSADWQLAPPLRPLPTEPLIFKTYRDSFTATDLAQSLAKLRITHLVIAGSQSDYCVRTTAQRAAAEGYDLTLVSDCHTTWDAEHDGVKISAEQAIAHTNQFFSGLRYPGQATGISTHDTVAL